VDTTVGPRNSTSSVTDFNRRGMSPRRVRARDGWGRHVQPICWGSEPTFVASDTEAVRELAERRWRVVEQNAEHAGHSVQTVFVDDLDALVAKVAERGIEPVKW